MDMEPISFSGNFLRLLFMKSESDVYILWGLFHKYLLPYLLYIVLGAHILGTIKHHFYDKHTSAIKRMNG